MLFSIGCVSQNVLPDAIYRYYEISTTLCFVISASRLYFFDDLLVIMGVFVNWKALPNILL